MMKKYDVNSIKVKDVYETRKITNEEILCLLALIETSNEYGFDIIFGDNRGAGGNAILKDESGLWITWLADERNGATFKGINNNCYDTCISYIKSSWFLRKYDILKNIKQEAIEYFNKMLEREISDEEILQFATDFRYIDELFFDDFVYMIKKIVGIETINDEEADKRLTIRCDSNFETIFQVEFMRFVIDIGKKAGIKYKEWHKVWNKISHDEWVKNILFKAVDISKYPELVIEALKEYKGYVSSKSLVRKK